MTKHGGKLLVECLLALGAKQSFGVPGESYLAVLDALYDHGNQISYTLCRNEGGASFMAEAYGKLTDTPGICFVTRGPGATNASIGVHTAMQASTPMLLFVGQVGTHQQGREAFQEVDYRAYFGTLAKWVTEIPSVDRIPEIISRAWSTAMSGRRGPVVVALPEDVLSALTQLEPCKAVDLPEAAPAPDALDRACDLFNSAERPLLLVGGSGWSPRGRADLAAFSAETNIPVVVASRFHDLMDNALSTYVGDAGVVMRPHVKEAIKSADVICAINIRFGEMTTDAYSLFTSPTPQQRIIHTHSSAEEIGKIYAPEVAIQSSPNEFLNALRTADAVTEKSAEWVDKWRDKFEASFEIPPQPAPVDMGKVVAHLREVLPDNSVVTTGAGNFSTWPSRYLRHGPTRRFLGSQSGAMGYGFPAAIAAKRVYPDATVVCFAGDGDFQMNCNELGTAMQFNAQPIVLVINNGSYGTIRAHQEMHYPNRVSGTELENPDFCQVARAYGFHSERVETTAEFAGAFERAMKSPTGALLDLNVGVEALTPTASLTAITEAAMARLANSSSKT